MRHVVSSATRDKTYAVLFLMLLTLLIVSTPLLTASSVEAQAAKAQYTSPDASRQQAEANPQNDTQAAVLATTTLDEDAARITESTDDPDNIVDRITIPTTDCEVDSAAAVVVKDNDGTKVRLVNGENATISATEDRVTVTGTDAGGNLTDLNQVGGDNQFGTVSDIVIGEVVRASGITCGSDDENEGSGNANSGATGDDEETGDEQRNGSCAGAREVENTGPTTTDAERQFRVTGETFRVTYDVTLLERNEFPTVTIDFADRFGAGPLLFVDESESDSFISTEGPGSFDLTIQVSPPNTARYEVAVEDCTGVAAEDNDEEIVNIPDDTLPNTGGVPISALASFATLLLIGTSLFGVAALRQGR